MKSRYHHVLEGILVLTDERRRGGVVRLIFVGEVKGRGRRVLSPREMKSVSERSSSASASGDMRKVCHMRFRTLRSEE